jgi:hypothetical protein
MRGFGGSCIAATREVWCRRSIFEQSFEHSFWSTRDSECPGKDDNRHGGRFHADRLDALPAGCNWFAFCVAVNGGRVAAFSNSDAYSRGNPGPHNFRVACRDCFAHNQSELSEKPIGRTKSF